MIKIALRTVHVSTMCIIGVICIFPILWMILSSFRPDAEIFKYSTVIGWHLLIPVKWTLINYIDLFTNPVRPIGRYIQNTFMVTIPVTVLSLMVNSIAAFAFAKLQFRLKRTIFLLFVSSLIIPGEVLLVPNYLVVNSLGWINTFQALIVPSIASVFGIFLLVQYFSDIPREILDAARMDGAGWFRIYSTIVLPAGIPALITLGLITFLGQWDSYLWPVIVINDDKKQVIQVAIATFSTLEITRWGRILAADTISTLPILLLFTFFQKYYVSSITMSSIKG